MKLALDNQIGYEIATQLKKMGHQIVYHARDEHDELWLAKAFKGGAEIFISPDWDVDIFCNKVDRKCIRLPQSVKGHQIFEYIKKGLKKYE